MKPFRSIIFSFILIHSLEAQSLEPKLYANAPIDVNLLMIGFDHTQGSLPQNPALGLEDPHLKIDSAVLVYGRSFDLLGQNAKFDLILPYSSLTGTAKYFGMDVSRNVSGSADAKARLTFNLLGAPALTMQEYTAYQQDLIIGMSIQTTMPTGQYDSSRLVNIGTNRWSIKPAIGISKCISDYTFELAMDAEFYTSNDDFYGGIKREQETIYSMQAHALYTFKRGMWLAVGTTYYWGGEYINDGIASNSQLSNSRLGITFKMPIDKQNAIKIYGSTGINVRYGTDFDAITMVWQYSWAD